MLVDSGQQLRQDDPSALKDIIGIVHTKVSNQDDILRQANRFCYLLSTDADFGVQLTHPLYD